jgi:hypothetical protein
VAGHHRRAGQDPLEVACAHGLTHLGAQRLEVGEQIEVVLRTEAELEAMVRSGTMVDGKTIGAFTLWKLGAGGGRA